MLDDKSEQLVQLMRSKTMGLHEPDGFKPELRDSVAVLDMNVRGDCRRSESRRSAEQSALSVFKHDPKKSQTFRDK
jgi:hypothetical protein